VLSLPGTRRPTIRIDETKTVRVEFEPDYGRALTRDVHLAYSTEINDVLLSALGQALGDWLGAGQIRIQLEGHGRDEFTRDINIDRTVGWFTTLYPVLLKTGFSNPGEHLAETKEMLRQVPQKGRGYGTLRYLAGLGEADRSALETQADIVFNYLGRLSEHERKLDAIGSGRAIGGRNHRAEPISFEGMMLGDRLYFHIHYDGIRFTDQSINALAGHYRSRLEQLVEHCLRQESRRYTASDFGNVKMTSSELQEILGSSDDNVA